MPQKQQELWASLQGFFQRTHIEIVFVSSWPKELMSNGTGREGSSLFLQPQSLVTWMVIKILIEQGADHSNLRDIDDDNSLFSSLVSLTKVEIVEFFLDLGLSFNGHQDASTTTEHPLWSLVALDHFQLFDLLIQREEPNVNETNSNWNDPH